MSEEIRTTSSTGAEKGVKPERYDLIPVEALAAVARLYGQGAKKYAAHNWRKGYEWSKSYAALQRHANAFWSGEEIDPEMGESHMACVIFHALSLITFAEEHREFDDRYLKSPTEQNLSKARVEFYNSLGPNKSATEIVKDVERIFASFPKPSVDPFEKPRPLFAPRTSEQIDRDILKSWGVKKSKNVSIKSPEEGDEPMRNEHEIKAMVIPNAAQVLSIEGTPNKTEFVRTLLKSALNHRIREEGSEDGEYGLNEIYVVTFAYTLGNMKAMLSTTRENNKYYELTYDVLNQVAYVDTYVKHAQTILEDI